METSLLTASKGANAGCLFRPQAGGKLSWIVWFGAKLAQDAG